MQWPGHDAAGRGEASGDSRGGEPRLFAAAGREKLHFINPVPINDIAERWINKFERRHLSALSALKKALEGEGNE